MLRGKVAIGAAIAILAGLLVAFGPPPEGSDLGNTLVISSATAPDSIDSGVSYAGISWKMQINAYNGLLTYRKEAGPTGTELVPDLAEAMPEISDGGRTLTFKVRRGVMFGPPENRELLPSDVKYTFDRNALIPSQGGFFYSVVEGYDEFAKTKKGTVSGIVADDEARTITFHLTRPDATFLNVLALPFSFTVPKGLPPKDMSQAGFSSATGPYMFTEYDPARRAVLKRNPAFKQWSEHTPDGKVDEIRVLLNMQEDNAITKIKQGKIDASMGAIPPARLPELATSDEWKPYIHEHEAASTSYIWMNTQVPPFDNVKVRQAVNWALNRRAMVKLGGGTSIPSSTILPGSMPGDALPEVYPEQDMDKAKALIAESGITPGEIKLWHFTTPPSPDLAQYTKEQLEALGFTVRTQPLDFSAYYGMVGAEKTNAQIGFGNWGQDFPEGATFIDTLLNGAYINPEHSNNLAWYRGHDEQIQEINALLDLDERAKRWNEIDHAIMEQAPWAPVSHGVVRALIGKRVGDYVSHPVYEMLYMKTTVDGSGTNNSEMHEFEVTAAEPAEGADAAAETDGDH